MVLLSLQFLTWGGEEGEESKTINANKTKNGYTNENTFKYLIGKVCSHVTFYFNSGIGHHDRKNKCSFLMMYIQAVLVLLSSPKLFFLLSIDVFGGRKSCPFPKMSTFIN